MIYDEHIERALLGNLISRKDCRQLLESILPNDFYLESHRAILSSINALQLAEGDFDISTITESLRRAGRLDSVGGMAYLEESIDWSRMNPAFRSQIEVLKEKSRLRSIMSLCELVSHRAEQGGNSAEILSDLQSTALEQQAMAARIAPVPIRELSVPAIESLKFQREFTGKVLGISTGIENLDRYTTGWRDGELTYVGALPGRGKTSFLIQCMYAAASEGFGVGCISLEMRSGQLMRRMGILHSGLHAFKFREPRTMNDIEFGEARRALISLGDFPIDLCDQSGLKPYQIASLARQMHTRGAKIIFVDFVQIIHEDGKERREAINRVSASLRDTCKALNIPFVVASQLARREADPNRRPTIQDLRESGNLEQDAHNVLLLFRPKEKSGEWTMEDEIIIDKQREGVTGIVPVRYDQRSLTYVVRT